MLISDHSVEHTRNAIESQWGRNAHTYGTLKAAFNEFHVSA